MGTYLLKGEVFMGVACVTLRLSLRKGIYVGHIQCDGMRKPPDRICQYIWTWSVGNVGHHFSRDGKNSQIQRVLIEGRGLESS